MCFTKKRPKPQPDISIDLKTFISSSLNQIIDGIIESQSYAKEHAAMINPPNTYVDNGVVKLSLNALEGHQIIGNFYGNLIDYDIAVEVIEKASVGGASEGQIGVVKMGLGFGGKIHSSTETANSQISRIKFSIPIFFPQQK